MVVRTCKRIMAKRILKWLTPPKLILTDFDGCLTNDFVYVNTDGVESIRATRKDGLGIERLKLMGIEVMVVSAEANKVVSARAKKLNIECIQDCHDKKNALINTSEKKQITLRDIWFIGNDINDLEALKLAGYSLCPKDASPEVKDISDLILPINGGDGILNFIARNLKRKE